MSGRLSISQLARFLDVLTQDDDPEEALRSAPVLVADALDADVAAVVLEGRVASVAGSGQDLFPKDELASARGRAISFGPEHGGMRHLLSSSIGEGKYLVLGKSDASFTSEEQELLASMARALGRASSTPGGPSRGVRGTNLGEQTAGPTPPSVGERERDLETLLDMQRSISLRAPLDDVLASVIAGTGELLGSRGVWIFLRDEFDVGRAIRSRATSGAPGEEAAALELAANVMAAGESESPLRSSKLPDGYLAGVAVHVDGTKSAALVVDQPARDLDERGRDLLVELAQITGMALANDAAFGSGGAPFYDPLTKLPNRALFLDRLSHALAASRRNGESVAVLFIDLDRFKAVNDRLGHSAGDELLRTMAKRLSLCLRPDATPARFGGDEFAVLMDRGGSPDGAIRVANRVIQALRKPTLLLGKQIVVGASVGIRIAETPDADPRELIRDADLAMYKAKDDAPNSVTIYEPAMYREMVERLDLEAELQSAIDHDELSVQYQPVFRLSDRNVVSVEALVRWDHPRHGRMPAEKFLALAEETGTIVEIGRWVLHAACSQLAALRQTNTELRVSVNLSPRQLRDPLLVEEVRSALAESNLPPGALLLEIREDTFLQDGDDESLTRLLEALSALGVSLVVDNFGKAYSTLRYLRRFPIDTVKIDSRFMQKMQESSEDPTMTQRVVALVKSSFHMATVAENVEDEAQLAEVIEAECEQGQGYHFSCPLDADDLSAYLSSARMAPTDGAHQAPTDGANHISESPSGVIPFPLPQPLAEEGGEAAVERG